jgi:tRNA 5-methylaminomethyl-2-thiouridine biosynthesis bifunctional protein
MTASSNADPVPTAAPFGPARVDWSADGTPCAPDYGDVYHAAAGAQAQAEHVFLAGNGLSGPGRHAWSGRSRFVVLETGFGLGNNFLATWAAWRRDARRCERLVFISLEKHPLRQADLQAVHARSALPELAAQLIARWPALTPDQHQLEFEDGRVTLLLVFGDALQTLPGLQAQVDAFYLDGFAPARNPEMWSTPLFHRLARLARPGATAATWSAARQVRDGLRSNGFVVENVPGFGGKRDMTVARYAPHHLPPLPAALRPHAAPEPTSPREALVIGSGLAGSAAARALARQGWAVTVLDRHPAPAQATSGNAGGLMHPIFNAPDSLHARWFRAAALHTRRIVSPWLAEGRLEGRLDGLLRLEARLSSEEARSRLARVGLPAEVVDWVEPDQAHRLTGLNTGLNNSTGGWWFAGGGWLSPSGLSRVLLDEAARLGSGRGFVGSAEVARIERDPQRHDWRALDAASREIARAPVLVLAGAAGIPPLMPQSLALPALFSQRGQTTVLQPHEHNQPGLPRLPLSGQGYGLSLPDGRLLIGATSQDDDPDPELRLDDQRLNLGRARELGLALESALDDQALDGRVGWRIRCANRLPLVGPPVDPTALAEARLDGARLDAPRLLPRCHDEHGGLYLLSGLASRGLTSAVLAGELLAAWATGAPFAVSADLRDALDPAR